MNRRFDSDLDAADAVAGIPEDELMARQEELDREARWTAFVAWLRSKYLQPDCHGVLTWAEVIKHSADALCSQDAGLYVYNYQQPYLDFAEAEGWDGVLVAIARAMREQAQERERLLTQG